MADFPDAEKYLDPHFYKPITGDHSAAFLESNKIVMK